MWLWPSKLLDCGDSKWKGVWTDGKMTTFECVSAWQTLMPSWMANKATQLTIWQTLPLFLTAASDWEKKASYGLFQWTTFKYLHSSSEWKHTAQHTPFSEKLSTLLFLFVTAFGRKIQIIPLCPFLVWTHSRSLIKSQSSGINLCYVKTVSSIFKLRVQVIYGNEFTIGAAHCASASHCCSTNSRPSTSMVSTQVLFSCIFHCPTVMQPHLSTLHLHPLLCVKEAYLNCYVFRGHIVFTD